MTVVFGHASVAQFLRSVLEDREAQGGYSLRTFAKDLAVSPAHLSQIMHGKKKLSPERRLEVARKLGLDEAQTRYFYLLAQLETAPSDGVRAEIRRQMDDVRHTYAEEQIDSDRFLAISDWYHVALLEMTFLTDFELTPESAAQRLGIASGTVLRALERLERLGLVRRDEATGAWKKTDQNVVFRTSRTNEAFGRFHRQMIELAKDAVDHQEIARRLVMSQTFCIDESQLPEAKELTRAYLQRMANLFEASPRHTRTYQLNVQFFDLTDGRPKREE